MTIEGQNTKNSRTTGDRGLRLMMFLVGMATAFLPFLFEWVAWPFHQDDFRESDGVDVVSELIREHNATYLDSATESEKTKRPKVEYVKFLVGRKIDEFPRLARVLQLFPIDELHPSTRFSSEWRSGLPIASSIYYVDCSIAAEDPFLKTYPYWRLFLCVTSSREIISVKVTMVGTMPY